MLDFIKNQRRLIVLVLLVLVSLQSVATGVRDRGDLLLPSRLILSVSYYPLNFINTVFRGIRNSWLEYLYLVNVKRDNKALRERIAQLEGEKIRIVGALIENERLRDLLKFKDHASAGGILAEIVGMDTSGEFKTVMLNKGAADGVESGMPVATNDGVVGKILQVSPYSSRVLLLIDHNSAIDVMVQRTRARAILEGLAREGLCTMKYISRTAEVEKGDLVVTSGFGGFFQKGIPVGTVISVDKKAYGVYQVVLVKPGVDFNKLEEVLVLPRAK